jgi:hypothetical protein
METDHRLEHALAYAETRKKSDRQWSTIYWVLHNLFLGASWVCQLVVVFGLAFMLYVSESSRNSANITLLIVSCIGVVLAALDLALSLGRRAKILAQSADTIELAISKYRDQRISADGLLKRLEEIIMRRLEQHD